MNRISPVSIPVLPEELPPIEMTQTTVTIEQYVDKKVNEIIAPLIESNKVLTKRVEELERQIANLQSSVSSCTTECD